MEDTARAVGSPSSNVIVIAGKDCIPRALSIKELGVCERECLLSYRKSYVETYSELIEFLPDNEKPGLIREKIEEAAKFDLSSLPAKYAYDPKKIVVTTELDAWLLENMSAYLPSDLEENGAIRTKRLAEITAAVLNADVMTDAEYQSVTKSLPKKTKIGYAQWWINSTMDGRLSMAYQAFKEYGVTKEQISEAVGNQMGKLIEAVNEIESLSTPQVGNG